MPQSGENMTMTDMNWIIGQFKDLLMPMVSNDNSSANEMEQMFDNIFSVMDQLTNSTFDKNIEDLFGPDCMTKLVWIYSVSIW